MLVELKKIDIENFKGIEKSTFVFDEHKTIISAPIGSGKTTLLEAFLYAMGYPIKNFKPKKYENNRWLEIPNTKTKVEVEIIIKGIDPITEERKLTLIRKDKTYDINDDRYTTLTSYQNAILEEFGMESYDLYCDLLLLGNFNSKETKVKRNFLLELVNVNQLLIKVQDSYDLLKEDFVKGLTNEEISKKIKRKLKELEEKQIELKTKLNVINENIKKYDFDYISFENTKIELEIEIEESNNEALSNEEKLKIERDKLQNDIYEKKVNYSIQTQKINSAIYENKQLLLQYQAKRSKVKEKLDEAKCREIDEVLICPTCGSKLSKNNEITFKLKNEKDEDIKFLETELQKIDDIIAKAEQSNKTLLENIQKLKEELTIDEMQAQLNIINKKLENISVVNKEVKENRQKLEEELNTINEKLVYKKIYNEQKEQLEKVKKEQIEVLKSIQILTKKSEQLKEYLAKIEDVTTNRINEFFIDTGIQWQLYENAKTNDNLSTTLELLWQDKRYSNCSRGERLCADFSLLYFLQTYYRAYFPIFIDNIGDLGGYYVGNTISQQILLQTSDSGSSLNDNVNF